jgi:hypothetical protein
VSVVPVAGNLSDAHRSGYARNPEPDKSVSRCGAGQRSGSSDRREGEPVIRLGRSVRPQSREATGRIGLDATGTTSYDVGDPVGRLDGARRHASWILEAPVDRLRPLDEHLAPLVHFADRRRSELASLRAAGYRIDLFCGVFANSDAQGGWVYEAELSRALADLNLAVSFDLY